MFSKFDKARLDVRECPNLLDINIPNCNFKKIRISKINRLKNLTIGNSDTSFLRKCKYLIALTISNIDFLDLDSLSKLTSLKRLALSFIKMITGSLSSLTKLLYLKLHNISKMGDAEFSEIPDLPPNLTHFVLSVGAGTNYSSYSDNFSLKPLSSCNNLELLVVKLYKQDLNLKDIDKLSLIKHIRIFSNFVENLETVENFLLLSTLHINTRPDSYDMVNLSRCLSLKNLSITSRELEDISFLENCNNLTNLNIWINSRVDLSPISTCINLVNIDLLVSTVNDVSPLLKLKRLEKLYTNAVIRDDYKKVLKLRVKLLKKHFLNFDDIFDSEPEYGQTIMETPD